MTDANYDKPQDRPTADRELIARAHNLMMATEAPMHRYVRQQWEVAMASAKVGLDAWRRIYPIEAADSLSESGQEHAREVDSALSLAFLALSKLSDEMEGIRHDAEMGAVTAEELTEMEREREEQGGTDQA